MSMAGNPSGADSDDAKLSWREREVVAALKRLANAQLQVAQIDVQLASAATSDAPAEIDVADAAALEELAGELAKLAKKSQSRFGGGAARGRVAELEAQQQAVLGRMGFASYDDYLATKDRSEAAQPSASGGIDPVVEGFARRELAAAEAAYRELLELPDEVDDEVADDAEDGGATDADAPGRNGAGPTIDLTG